MEKPLISKYVFKVSSKEYITPHYIRIKLRSEADIDFDQCSPGANNKIFIPPVGTNEVQFATFDPDKGEWVMPDDSRKPLVRTYTHRAIDPITKEISIDFVNHGDNGPASAWALHAEVNDELGVAMKIRESIHYPEADWYLFVGDATAIPVISCLLESLPKHARGMCILEVPTEDDIHPEIKHEGFQISWLFNAHPEKGSYLFDLVKKVQFPTIESTFAYIAAEYQTVKNIRQYFKDDLLWTSKDFYAFSYWKAGVAEDKSTLDRREERG